MLDRVLNVCVLGFGVCLLGFLKVVCVCFFLLGVSVFWVALFIWGESCKLLAEAVPFSSLTNKKNNILRS